MPEITLLEATLDETPRDERAASAKPAIRLAGVPKVLHVINGEHYAGAERVQDLLALRLPEFGYEAGFACVKPGRFPELRQAKDVPLVEVPMLTRFDVRAAWSLSRLVRREGFALIHAHTPRSLLVARPAALLAGVPLVYHVHSPTARDTTHRLRNWVNATMERASLSGAARLIAVSESLGRHMRGAGYSAERVAVVPNGVPTAKKRKTKTQPTKRWTLGVVALFRPRKGLEVLLDTLALLRNDGLDVELRAIGAFETPAYEAEILSQATRLKLEDRITWTGFTRNVNAELEQLDLFVLPSLFGEGLPMVVLESMAAGVPVVATRVEGVPEAIRDGVDGLLAAPGDPSDLALKVAAVVCGDANWSALRESALVRQSEHFSDRSMAAGVARVYDEVLRTAGK